VNWPGIARLLGTAISWLPQPGKCFDGIKQLQTGSWSLRRAVHCDIGVFASKNSANRGALLLLQSLKVKANGTIALCELIDRARECKDPTPLTTESHHHGKPMIKRLRADTFSVSMSITRTWGHYESKEVAAFAAALLVAGVPDYAISTKIDGARAGFGVGPVAPQLRALIVRPLSMGVTLPPLRPVPVGTPGPAADEPTPDCDALQVLASSTPGPDNALRKDMANPDVWVTILSNMCRRAHGVELQESTIAVIASVFAKGASGLTRNGRGRVADVIGTPGP